LLYFGARERSKEGKLAVLQRSADKARDRGLGRVQFQSMPEMVAESLRQGIIAGKLKPGERLVEQKLAAELGIGQPTLREAFKELEYQGFVRKIPNKGTYVTRLSQEDFSKILEVRMALESLIVERAARNMTDVAAKELDEIVRDMEAAARKFNLARFHKSDVAFHRRLWKLGGNEFLEMALERVAFGLFAFVLLQRESESTAEFLAATDQHRQILQGLRSGDPEEARKTFEQSTVKFWKDYHQVEIDKVDRSTIASKGQRRGRVG
jgi:DNA-binding GntR family transcriptional regulator